MAMTTSLYTCRYWAFGPGCPNIANGVNICRFAHWDTGRLASPYDQRGTCRFWLQGNCMKKGHACYYEHRNTGVEGLYQGRITLDGFNLEVATAAGNSGFNTFNHAALFDLIWAVKRIALRASKGAIIDRPRPPKDPVYPDRFRPSGVGDNTKRKRPAQELIPPHPAPVKLEVMVKPQQTNRQFRYRNRTKKHAARPFQAPAAKPAGYETQGSQENPIDLLSLSDDDTRPAAAKRQKLDTVSQSIPRPAANTSQARAAPESSQALVLSSSSVNPDTMHIDGRTYVRTRHDDAPRDGHGSRERRLQSLQVDLHKVKDAIKFAADNIKWCNNSMSTAFEAYRDVLARRDIHSSLEKLGENFETVRVASLEGVDCLNDILELVN